MRPSKINKKWRTKSFHHFDIDPWNWVGITNRRHRKYDYDY